MWTDDATAASSGADPAPTAAPAVDPTPTAEPAAPQSIPPQVWATPTPAPTQAQIETLIDQKIKAAIDDASLAQIGDAVDQKIKAAIDALGVHWASQLGQLRAMIIEPATIEDFIDRKIKTAFASAPPPTAAPAQPGAAQPGATHAEQSGNVGATGAHGVIGANAAK
jgi:hypothetical protein